MAIEHPLRILLINPNSSVATTDMMVALAQEEAGPGMRVEGATATQAPPMITNPAALDAAAPEVIELGLACGRARDGLIVAAFGDPGLAELRASGARPAVGIAEAAMLEAARGGRRFGIATTTPGLVGRIAARVAGLGLAGQHAGIRITKGDPGDLMRDPGRLRDALARAVEACIVQDGAEAVIIGGGPLGDAARQLQPTSRVPVIAPVPAAVRRLIAMLEPMAPGRGRSCSA